MSASRRESGRGLEVTRLCVGVGEAGIVKEGLGGLGSRTAGHNALQAQMASPSLLDFLEAVITHSHRFL